MFHQSIFCERANARGTTLSPRLLRPFARRGCKNLLQRWALAGISQAELAKAASINVTTISAMEGKGAATLASGLDTIIELLGHGQPGCRLKAK
jgi:hypothetical protein